jgi:hypothetical protein
MIYHPLKNQLLAVLSEKESVGFFISGGFDSTLLLHVCCEIRQQHKLDTMFKIFTVPRTDNSQAHSLRVVNFVSSNYHLDLPIYIVGDPALHHSQQVMSGIAPSLDQVDCVLLADTSNPESLPDGPVRIRSDYDRVIQPFFDFTKKDTVALAIELGIVDDIATVTHTCTESIELRCGQCWQCRERAWGFQQNDYIDLGRM